MEITANGHQQLGQAHEGFDAFARAVMCSARITAFKRKAASRKAAGSFLCRRPTLTICLCFLGCIFCYFGRV